MIEEHVLKELFRSHLGGRFEVRKILGVGGMGIVVQAYDNKMKVLRAIKVFNPDTTERAVELQQRFENEASVMAQIEHKHIVRVFDVGTIEHYSYIVLEWIDGGSLGDHIEVFGAIPPRQAVRMMYDLCEALTEAHVQGVVHRDIKPDNILFTKTGIAKVADFGIAHIDAVDFKLTGTKQGLGTLGYMSPEQMSDAAKVDARADVYAMGVMFWVILSGTRYQGLCFALELDGRPELFDGIPECLHSVIEDSVSFRADDRYESMAAFQEVLSDVFEDLPPDPDSIHPLGTSREFKKTDPSMDWDLDPPPTYVGTPDPTKQSQPGSEPVSDPVSKPVVDSSPVDVVRQVTDWARTHSYKPKDGPLQKQVPVSSPVLVTEEPAVEQPVEVIPVIPSRPKGRRIAWTLIIFGVVSVVFLTYAIFTKSSSEENHGSNHVPVVSSLPAIALLADASIGFVDTVEAKQDIQSVAIAEEITVSISSKMDGGSSEEVKEPKVVTTLVIPEGTKLKAPILLRAEKSQVKVVSVLPKKPKVIKPKRPEPKGVVSDDSPKVHVSLQLPAGDTAKVWFVGAAGRIKLPGNVPPGTYRVVAQFKDQTDEIVVSSGYVLKSDASPKLVCSSSFANCKIR